MLFFLEAHRENTPHFTLALFLMLFFSRHGSSNGISRCQKQQRIDLATQIAIGSPHILSYWEKKRVFIDPRAARALVGTTATLVGAAQSIHYSLWTPCRGQAHVPLHGACQSKVYPEQHCRNCETRTRFRSDHRETSSVNCCAPISYCFVCLFFDREFPFVQIPLSRRHEERYFGVVASYSQRIQRTASFHFARYRKMGMSKATWIQLNPHLAWESRKGLANSFFCIFTQQAQTGASILYTLSEWMQPANGIRLGLVMLTERANAYDAFSKFPCAHVQRFIVSLV